MAPERDPVWPGPGWAESRQPWTDAGDRALTDAARIDHPTVRWWWGARQLDGRYGAYCYLCDRLVATWDRRWPVTAQALVDVMAHRSVVHGGTHHPPGSKVPGTSPGASTPSRRAP